MIKILLIEDNPLNQDMLSRRLARQGYEVAVAIDGAAGLSMAKTENPDLILMDMNIPIIDGWEATRRLKADAQTQSIPVIALTAHAMVGDREKAMKAGCDDYATKPVQFKQLLKTIRTFTGTTTQTGPKQVGQIQIGPTQISPAQTPSAPAVEPSHQQAPSPTPSTPSPSIPTVVNTHTPSQLPSQPTPPPFQTPGQTPQTVTSSEPATLLVVNDNITNRQVLSTHLQRKGYTIVTADDSQTALNILQEFSIDLVLLDIMVPEEGNLQALQKIRETYPKTTLAVVMLTVQDSDESIVKAFELGVSDYVTKPINLAIIMARIQSQLETLKATRQQNLGSSSSPFINSPTQPPTVIDTPNTHVTTNNHQPPKAIALESVSTTKPLARSPQKRANGQSAAVLSQTKSYPLNSVLSESALGQVKLIKNPHPSTGQLLCLLETFRPNLTSQSLLANLRTAMEEVLPQLKAISRNERIAELVSFFEENRSFCWIQTYTEGHLFSEELGNEQRASVRATLTSIQDILEALLPFHEQNIVHSSIQPQHLWRAHPSNRLVLINLGLSQRICVYLAHNAIENRQAFTIEHDYMPIEQRIGQPALSSDIYAVGLIALQLLTGETTAELTNMLLSHGSTFDHLPMVTPELAKILAKMLPQEPAERYPTALEALQDVRALVRTL